MTGLEELLEESSFQCAILGVDVRFGRGMKHLCLRSGAMDATMTAIRSGSRSNPYSTPRKRSRAHTDETLAALTVFGVIQWGIALDQCARSHRRHTKAVMLLRCQKSLFVGASRYRALRARWCFGGAGTTTLVTLQLGHRAISIDIHGAYTAEARRRVKRVLGDREREVDALAAD
jgi:hypothetical protein